MLCEREEGHLYRSAERLHRHRRFPSAARDQNRFPKAVAELVTGEAEELDVILE